MKKKLNAFFDGMASILNLIPESTYHKSNYLKPTPIKRLSGLNGDENCIAKDMQKILTQDLGHALNQVKDNLNADDQKQFDQISKLHNETERHYR